MSQWTFYLNLSLVGPSQCFSGWGRPAGMATPKNIHSYVYDFVKVHFLQFFNLLPLNNTVNHPREAVQKDTFDLWIP